MSRRVITTTPPGFVHLRVREAITVAATDQNDTKTSLSNFGAVVDLFAPGAAIVSAHSTADDAVFTRTGTSSAAPFVAGLAARYLSTRPGDAPDAVAQAITGNATPDKVVNPGAGSPNLLAYAAVTLSDDFNDNVHDASKWNTIATPGSIIAEQNGRLEITATAAMPSYDGYISATTVDPTDSRISVQPVPVGFGTYFALRDPSGNSLLLGLSSDGHLLMRRTACGVMSQSMAPYNAAQQRFWRFRHNRANDTINWETSPDGVTWTTQSTMPTPFPITNLQTQLIAGKQTTTIPSGTAIFDNLRVERNEGGQARTGGSGSSSSSSSSGATYNAVTDFSSTQNPTGPWAYSYKPSGGAFTLLMAGSSYFGAGTNTWALSSQDCCPMVTKNNTSSTYTYVNAPKPQKGQNYHLWLTGQFGLKKLVEHIWMPVGIAKTCPDGGINELKAKMERMFGKGKMQMELYFQPPQGGRRVIPASDSLAT